MKPYIEVPNPLWWSLWLFIRVFYPAFWLYFRLKSKPKEYFCDCGKSIGNSLWGWCSVECLQRQADKERLDG